jgi:hypothetical protein
MAKVTSVTPPPHPSLGKVVREAIRSSVPLYFLPVTFVWRISHRIYQRVIRKEAVQEGSSSLSTITDVADKSRRKDSQETPAISYKSNEEYRLGKRPALIILASLHDSIASSSIEHHLPVLRHCWILATHQSLSTAAALAERYRNQIPNIYYGDPGYLVDPSKPQSTYDIVVRILAVEAEEAGLKRDEIIADITGGSKLMSAAMVLACVKYNCNMQFITQPLDANGQVIQGAIVVPTLVDTTFTRA